MPRIQENELSSNAESKLRSEIAILQEELAALKNYSRRKIEISKAIFSALDELNNTSGHEFLSAGQQMPDDTQEFVWNSPRDTRYSHKVRNFENVLYIFHKHWEGIRAAAGSLPGKKLAITDAPLSPEVLVELIGQIIEQKPHRIVFHGVSHNTEVICKALAKQGLSDIMSIAFHGSLSQWCSEPERKLAFAAIELQRKGYVKGLQFMKTGIEIPGVNLFAPLLFNLSPKVEELGLDILTKTEECSTFIPGWGSWIKNVYNSALGAALSSSISHIYHFATNLELPASASQKLRHLAFKSREDTFVVYAMSDFAMNVSLTDCHPMVNVESQALGRPCVRSNLFLDALEDHPYLKITTVTNPNSPTDIRETIEQLMSVPASERNALALDYQNETDKIGLERYREFLGIN